MYIPKTIRVLGYFATAFTGTALFVALTRPFFGPVSFLLAPFVFVVLNVVGGLPIDAFDLWLRRSTRDPIWLLGHEGREWLKTEEGQRWSEANDRRDESLG